MSGIPGEQLACLLAVAEKIKADLPGPAAEDGETGGVGRPPKTFFGQELAVNRRGDNKNLQ
jgi:hypothetical protein